MELNYSSPTGTLKGAEVFTSAPFVVRLWPSGPPVLSAVPGPKKARRALALVLVVPAQREGHDQAQGNEAAAGCGTESNPTDRGSVLGQNNNEQRSNRDQGQNPRAGLQIHDESLPRVCMCMRCPTHTAVTRAEHTFPGYPQIGMPYANMARCVIRQIR